ncbi:MAG: GNAT family protein [Actinomycetes bacterium]
MLAAEDGPGVAKFGRLAHSAVAGRGWLGCGREFGTGSWLAPALRGEHLADPARWCALRITFELLDAQSVVSSTLVGNEPSRRVSQRSGYLADGVSVDTSRGVREDMVRFRISRERWRELERPVIAARGVHELRTAVLGEN